MTTSIGVNLRVTGHCSQGGRKYMEDAFVVAYQQTEDGKDLEYAFFGIYDGHGGKEAAQFAKEHLMDNILNLKYFWSEDDSLVLKAIRDGFIATHLAMWKEVDKWPRTVSGLPSTAGTTASIGFIRRGKLYTGHVGDSKIVLGYSNQDSDVWQPESLTKDHKPDSPLERKRIYNSGGLVMNKSGVERVVWKRPRTGHQGPVRRSTDFDKIPFLAVARSLGDLWSYDYYHEEFVVSPEPDVSVVTLDPEKDHCIILASDGLWNMLTPWDAVLLVQDAEQENEGLMVTYGLSYKSGWSLRNPSKILVDCALDRWNRLRMRADNTSVVTVMLDPPGPPKNALLRQQAVLKMNYPDGHYEADEIWDHENEMEENPKFHHHQKINMCPSAYKSKNYHREMRLEYPESETEAEESKREKSDIDSSDAGSSGFREDRRASNSPLQPCSNFLPKYALLSSSKSLVRRGDIEGSENSPCPFPRWSKSASGRTSLSKLASWSKTVSRRRMSDPFPRRTSHCASNGHSVDTSRYKVSSSRSYDAWCHCADTDCTESHKMTERDKQSSRSFSGTSSTTHCSTESKDLASCSGESSSRDGRILSSTTLEHLTNLKKAIKRKFPGTEISESCLNDYIDHYKYEGISPWKRKPVTRLNITTLKAINEFKHARHQIQNVKV